MANKYGVYPEDLDGRIKWLFDLEEDMKQDNKDCSVEVLIYKMQEEVGNIKGLQEAILEHETSLKNSQKKLLEITEEINSRDLEE